jgi:exopolyphosphatase/guanosine-5'-triphosphate,3'-diphosphate pyrophosphatase
VSPAALVKPSVESRAAPAAKTVPDVLAAVDLGSNSFHMVVARYSHGQLVIIDRLREMVRLAEGVEENGRIDK